ncbi:MAG: hypothetical protein R3C61_17195 [Bacteroidia bacterium]
MQEQVYLRALGESHPPKKKTIARKLLTDSPATENVEDFLWTVVMLPNFNLFCNPFSPKHDTEQHVVSF